LSILLSRVSRNINMNKAEHYRSHQYIIPMLRVIRKTNSQFISYKYAKIPNYLGFKA